MFTKNIQNVMNATIISKQDLEGDYGEIVALFDLTEELVGTVDSKFVKDQEEQYQLVEPLIEHIGESVDVLTEEFIAIVETPEKAKKTAKNRVEGALRKIFAAMDNYRQRVQQKSRSVAGMYNIADGIVDKIQRQLEKVVMVFLNLLNLSLDRIMHKSQIEELKRHEPAAMRLNQLGY